MTLILSEITSHWALQVSDRLLTTPNPTGAQPFDHRSNKTVIVEAANGVAALAFTGLAYFRGMPADSWIATQLNGDEHPILESDAEFCMRLGIRRTRWPSLGFAIGSLANALSALAHDPRSGLRGTPVQIATAGWFWYRRRRPRPFLGFIAPMAPDSYGVGWIPRSHGHYFRWMPMPNVHVSGAEREELGSRLGSANLDQSVEHLVDSVRRVAGRTDTVGSDCMVVSISHPLAQEPLVLAHFRRSDPAVHAQHGSTPTPTHTVYSPWVVGRHICLSPMAMIGGGIMLTLGPYQLRLEGPSPDAPRPPDVAFLSGPQPRRIFP